MMDAGEKMMNADENISDSTISLSVCLWGGEKINVPEVRLTVTIGEIKEVICDKLIQEIGETYAYGAEFYQMVLFGSSIVIDGDTTKTLGQVLADQLTSEGYLNAESEDLLSSEGYLSGETDDDDDDDDDTLSDEEPEDDTHFIQLSEGDTVIIQLIPWNRTNDDDDDDDDDDDELTFPEDAFTLKKPNDRILPSNSNCFRVCGDLLVYRETEYGVRKRYIPFIGLSFPLEQVTKLSTSASLVLLAFNEANLDVLEEFRALTSISECELPNTLVLRVGWDKLSYLFLRLLRRYLADDVPIVAVTDLDVHHLDLLAFLGTPPHAIPKLYDNRWDLSEECARLGINDNECVDIKWLGIRPSDAKTDSRYHTCFANASRIWPDDFHEVYKFLNTHPFVTTKTDWMEELEKFSPEKLHRSLPYIAGGVFWRRMPTNEISFVCDKYLTEKVKERKWI